MTFSDRWTVRVPTESTDAVALLRRAATYLEAFRSDAVERVVMDRQGSDLVLTACLYHHELPTDLEYLDLRFAAQFDAGDDPRDDFDFMVGLADEVGARTIVDIGCGTGRLASYLATADRQVIGVDPAPPMIAVARQRPGAQGVEWIVGDASAITRTDIDLVVMTGNISGYILDDGEWAGVLGAIHRALRPGGRFAFGSRNPADRAWERWGGGAFLENGRVRWPDTGRFENGRVHASPEQSLLVYGDEVLIADSEYRIRSLDELHDSLTTAGFEIEQLYGGWDRRPLAEAGEDLVFIALCP